MLFFTLLFSAAALAAPATDASVEKLLAVTKVEAMSDAIGGQMDRMKAQLKESLGAGKSEDAKMKALNKEIDEATQEFKKENVTFASFKADIVKLYKESWSEEEINDLIKFYETPTGKKSIETAPMMMQKTMNLVQGRLQERFPAFQEKIKAIVEKHMPEKKEPEKKKKK